MEVLNNIFVPYKIAVQLKEIGFDEPCIACQWYSDLEKGKNHLEPTTNGDFEDTAFDTVDYSNPNILPRPTWEQVKKWFREKGFYCNIHIIEGLEKTFLFTINKEKRIYESDLCTDYETAREQLIYKLIENYENGKKDR